MIPAEFVDPGAVEELAGSAVGLGGIVDDVALETDYLGDCFRQLPDGELYARISRAAVVVWQGANSSRWDSR